MPIYEYKCNKCGHTFDAFQRLGSDGSDLECPKCGTAKPQKLFSAFASSGGGGGYTGGGSACGPGGFT